MSDGALMFPVFLVSPNGLEAEREHVEALLWSWNERFLNGAQTCLLPVSPEQVDPDECDLMIVVLRSDKPVSIPTIELLASHAAKDRNMAICVLRESATDPTVGALLAAAEESVSILSFSDTDELTARIGRYITEVGRGFARQAMEILAN